MTDFRTVLERKREREREREREFLNNSDNLILTWAKNLPHYKVHPHDPYVCFKE